MKISLGHYRHFLDKYLRPQWVRVLFLTLLLFGGIGLQLANPQVLRYFIDTAAAGGSLENLARASILFIAIALGTQVLTVIATYVSESVGWSATNALREDLTEHCLRLDMAWHKRHTPGELIERVDGDVNAMSVFFSRFVIHIVGNMLLMLGVLVLLFREDLRIGVALTVYATGAMTVMIRMRNLAVPYMTESRESSAQLFGFIEERLSGLPDIRANGGGSYVMRRLFVLMREYSLRGRAAWRADGIFWVITITLWTTGFVLAFAIGAALFQAGVITIGTVFLLYQYTEMLRRPLEQITEQLKELQKATAGLTRVQQLLDTRSEMPDGSQTFPKRALSVELQQVSFGYGDEDMVLRDISFYLPAGEVLGVLGKTGSGKTSLARLVLRLYDPACGTVRIGGVDAREGLFSDLRRGVGMVTQDVQIFEGTLRDNVTLFDRGISDQRAVSALDELGLTAWLAHLPEGLDTVLGAQRGLSAGEAQLLAFARVFLRDPGLVILDEASSRLDPTTESLIESAVDRLLQNRSGIIIAHRLATVQRADDILILDDGKVLEYGPRIHLAADSGSHFSSLMRTGLEEVLV